jgi:hypothetical protein
LEHQNNTHTNTLPTQTAISATLQSTSINIIFFTSITAMNSLNHPLRSIGAPTTLSKSILHPQHEDIEAHVNQYLADTWEWPSTRHRLGFLSWKLSDTALRMFATGEYERVKLACELLLLGFLMDGKSSTSCVAV